jgi:GGDEF domain-containing protein
MFDVARSLDVKSYFKFTYAFDPSVVMSPFCLPKNILEPLVNDLLEYIEPNLTWKTKVYKESLVSLINRESFDEQWPNSYKDGLKRGKEFQVYLDDLRNTKLKFVDTLHGDAVDWWDRI